MICPLFHPTTTILIDENKAFLSTLNLKSEDTLYQVFDDPLQALTYCQEKTHPLLQSKGCSVDNISIELNAAHVNECMKFIKTVLSNPNRFATVSVIVVNHSHFAQVIDKWKKPVSKQSTKIIVIADDAEQSEATALLADKKIDQFFLKNDASLEEKIKNAITEMQQAYFAELGQSISKTAMMSLFKDAMFLDLFSKIMQKLQIYEYYFCDNSDSFVLIDKEGTAHVLVVRSKSDLIFSAEYARMQKVYSELVNRILMGRLIPFFGSSNRVPINMEDWIIHTHRAKKIEGTKDYFYALIEGRKTAVLPCIQHIRGFAAVVAEENLTTIECN